MFIVGAKRMIFENKTYDIVEQTMSIINEHIANEKSIDAQLALDLEAAHKKANAALSKNKVITKTRLENLNDTN